MIVNRYAHFCVAVFVASIFFMPLSPVFGQEDVYAHHYDYQFDEEHRRMLEAAWAYYIDDDERRRDVSLRIFQDFIDKYPDSPMVAEVYYRMGTLYSSAANRLFDEQADFDRMNDFFVMAVEAYGPGWAKYKQIAWTSIANTPGIDLADRVEFYRWMIDSRENILWLDIHPARELAQYYKGATALMSVETRGNFVAGPDGENYGVQDAIIQPAMRVSARNIVRRLGLEELQQLEREFEGYYIAEEARKKIGVIQADITDTIDSPLDAPVGTYIAGALTEERSDSRGALSGQESSVGPKVRIQSGRDKANPRASMKYFWVAIGLCILVCVVIIALLLRIRQSRSLARNA